MLNIVNLWFSVIFTLVSSAGFISNLVIVIPNIYFLSKIAPSSFLVFWMCLFDSIAIANNLFITISNLVYGEISHNTTLCQIHAYFAVFGNISSILLCMGLTLFRYLIIVHQRDLPVNSTTWYFLGSVLITGTFSAAPFILNTRDTFILRPSNIHCAFKWSEREFPAVILSFFCCITAVVTLGFIVYAYAAMMGKVLQVFQQVQDHTDTTSGGKKRVVEVGTVETKSVSNGVAALGNSANSLRLDESAGASVQSAKRKADKNMKAKMEKRQRELMMQSLVVVGAFMIGWMPYMSSLALFEFISESTASPVFDFLAILIVAVYESANPFIILKYDRDIRRNCEHSIVLLNTLLVAGFSLVTGELVPDSVICQLHASVAVFASIASILLCFGLTLFRYLIVVHQVSLPRNFSLGYVVTIVALASTVAVLPFMLGPAEPFYGMRPSRVFCAPNWSIRSVQSSIVILVCFSVSSITLCFIIYAYTAMVGRVVQVLMYTKGAAYSAVGNPEVKTGKFCSTSVEQGSVVQKSKTEKGANKETAEMEKLQRELMIQSIVIVGAFLTGWTPYVIS
ncbi:hypothetical protein HDU77_007917 [Chytriomyces hyalinus]|nr:hypothetical protein HDU77_007917 [Chytriomyces hyalinus]